MKFSKLFTLLLVAGLVITGCGDSDNGGETGPTTPIDENAQFTTADQMGRPAINTVFVNAESKNTFNTTIPSAQAASFDDPFLTKLNGLTQDKYTTNALGQDAETFTGLLSTDVLNVSLTGTTTFFDGTNVLTGRALADDVISVELLLIFGGPNGDGMQMDGTDFSGLIDDNVSENDKEFLSTFPYLAAPF
ncbi:MAG: DUF4331 family protein [Balneola sp.]